MTNLIKLRTIEEFTNDFKPTYVPIMPLFLDGAKQYNIEVGDVVAKTLNAVGDIRARMYGPKDTEIHQIDAKDSSKKFSKYFFAAQYRQSNLQSTEGYEAVVAQVLDEHNKQNDSLLITGDGVNNGLMVSSDPNYVTNNSVALAAVSGNYLASFYANVAALLQDAQELEGRILVLTYGSTLMPVYNGLFATTNVPFTKALGDAFPEVSFAKMPSAVTPAGENGMLIINLDQIRLLYTTLPKVYKQGVNEELDYAWTNFIMGSSAIDVKNKGAITKQPFTLA